MVWVEVEVGGDPWLVAPAPTEVVVMKSIFGRQETGIIFICVGCPSLL